MTTSSWYGVAEPGLPETSVCDNGLSSWCIFVQLVPPVVTRVRRRAHVISSWSSVHEVQILVPLADSHQSRSSECTRWLALPPSPEHALLIPRPSQPVRSDNWLHDCRLFTMAACSVGIPHSRARTYLGSFKVDKSRCPAPLQIHNHSCSFLMIRGSPRSKWQVCHLYCLTFRHCKWIIYETTRCC